MRSSDLIVCVCPVHPEKSVRKLSDGPKQIGGQAKRARRRRTERPLRTEPHWSFSTPLILNDQSRSLRRNGVRSSNLIPNDQLRRNGVRSSDLIVSVSPSVRTSRPSGSKADRDEPRSADERSESAGVGPKAPGGRAKGGRRRRTERTLRTEPH